jgi:hypothetical protein
MLFEIIGDIKFISGDFVFKIKLRRIFSLIVLVIVFAVFSGCADSGNTIKKFFSDEKGSSGENGTIQENKVPCPLSGDMVSEASIDRRPLAIMVENAPVSRPQSGLDKAEVVYEILAEGAITRFMAVYLHEDSSEVGPVRSARPYYIERMFEFDAIYAYCGGSPAAKEMIVQKHVAALDEFGVGQPAFWRIKGRKAPHNLYTDTEKLRKVAIKRDYERTVTLPEFEFLAFGEENQGGITSDSVKINYPKVYSVVRWKYDSTRNTYLRFQGGLTHRDAVTGQQLTGANIMMQFVNSKVLDNEGRMEMTMVGRGRALMFTGGKVYDGTWTKDDMKAQTYFYLEDGTAFKLNPGQTWIQVVPKGAKVEY